MSNVFIIAEAGVNHNGDINLAKKLIDAAAAAGADAVKFQTFNTDNEVSKFAPKAEYQLETTDEDESQYEMIKKLELSREDHLVLMDYCKASSIKFLSSPFENDAIDLLAELGLDIMKIPSGEITNFPFMKKIGALNKKVIMSTGMATIGEVEQAIDILTENGTDREKITLLHCNTEYPTPYEDVNLRAMVTLADSFKLPVGYSDHTKGIEIPLAAVAMGAVVIEKHFTLDKTMEGPDHKASLEPGELSEMVKAIRNVETALGTGIKKPSKSEKKNIAIARKSIVALCDIKAGEVFTEENVTTKRPGSGVNPMDWNFVLGRKAPRDFGEDELIEL